MKGFEHPYIVGIVSASASNGSAVLLKKRFCSLFKKKKLPFVYLVLKVEPKYLKNLISCMRSMDVVGVNLPKGYEKRAVRLVDRLDSTALASGRVNLIAKKGRKFVGYYLTSDVVEGSVSLWTCK